MPEMCETLPSKIMNENEGFWPFICFMDQAVSESV
jgi:hypothetical protein